MSLWLVRGGPGGAWENRALEKGIAAVGWIELGDLSEIATREELRQVLEKAYPDAKGVILGSFETQLWSFLREMQTGDLVALPLKQRPAVVFGRVAGPYQYRRELSADAPHTRPVEWIKEVARTAIDQDLLFSLGARRTVCRVHRNNAEERVRALLEGEPFPPISVPPDATDEGQGEIDLEATAQDQIRRFIGRRFKGHRFTHLVAAVLSAQGYKLRVAPTGPDGGADILAGSGELGLDRPRIAVQVKSGDAPVDIKDVRELQGAMRTFQADHGLFVAWGGFRQSVDRELPRLFFEIRLWNSDDLLQEIFRLYDKMPGEVQTELPLKRIWVLMPPEEDTP